MVHMGTRIEKATLLGFPYDRHWVIVKEATHRFITQRNFQKLAKILPVLPDDVLDGSEHLPEHYLTIRLPCTDTDAERIRIPLIPNGNPVLKCELISAQIQRIHAFLCLLFRQITVCEWTGVAMDEGNGAAEKLSDFLETPVRLFRFVSDSEIRHRMPRERMTRPVNPEFVYGFETTFTDGFPYLIINEVTLSASLSAPVFISLL